jgi:6-phosphogluconolactonase
MKNLPYYLLLLIPIFVSGACVIEARGAEGPSTMSNYLVFAGPYTGPKSLGIYAYKFETATGKLTPLGLAGESNNPSFLAVHPNHHFVYAVNERGDYEGQKSGSVSAFALDPKTGKLTLLNVVASGGVDPCHISIDKTRKFALVANYGSGSVAAFPILPDGRLGKATALVQHTGHGIDPERQEAPHAHCILPSPDNHFVVAADLGADRVVIYRFDATHGTLTPNTPPFAAVKSGSGPRHLAFHPNGKFLYVNSEMGSIVTVFSYDSAPGTLKELQTITTLPGDFKGASTTAEIAVHPSGRFLYCSNRGHDSIAVYSIDPVKGTLAPVEIVSSGGKEPRHFEIDPSGNFLLSANQNSNNLAVFRIDQNTGRLSDTGQVLEIQAPVCLKFAPMQ